MTTKSIIKAIKAIDGIVLREKEGEVFGMAHGYDIEFIGNSVLTIRKTTNRKQYDVGSDYNPGGYIFIRRIKDIKYYILGSY